MANFVRNVLIDGVKYAVGDKRIEGDNFAYIQVPEAITVGTNLTDLTPIQKALDSTDGSLLYVPSLNALFSPTASSDPTIRIWASTVGDKGYQLKATLDTSGVLQSAVVNEAAGGDIFTITKTEFDTFKAEGEQNALEQGIPVVMSTDAMAFAKRIADAKPTSILMVDSSGNYISEFFPCADKVLSPMFPPGAMDLSKYMDDANEAIYIVSPPGSGTFMLIITDESPLHLTSAELKEKFWTDDEPFTPISSDDKLLFLNRILLAETYNQPVYVDNKLLVSLKRVEQSGVTTYFIRDIDLYTNGIFRIFYSSSGLAGATLSTATMDWDTYKALVDATDALTTDLYVSTDTAKYWAELLWDDFEINLDTGLEIMPLSYKPIESRRDEANDLEIYTYNINFIKNYNVTGATFEPAYYNRNIEVFTALSNHGIKGIKIVPKGSTDASFNISTNDYNTIYSATEGLTTDPYVTTTLAKSIGQKLIDHFYIPEWDIDHFTVSAQDTTNPTPPLNPVPISFYTYADNTETEFDDDIRIIKFTTTAEIYNGDITVFYDSSNSNTAVGMRIDPKPEEFVRISKEYMEVETMPQPSSYITQNKISVSDDTLNINSVITPITHPDTTIIHYPKSVIFKGDSEFKLEFGITWPGSWGWTSGWYGVDKHYDGSTTYLEYSCDGKNWINLPKTPNTPIITSKFNEEFGGHVIFVRGNSAMYARDMEICQVRITSDAATYIDLYGDISGLCPTPDYGAMRYFFMGNTLIRDCSRLKMHSNAIETVNAVYSGMFMQCTNLVKPPVLPATKLSGGAYSEMFGGCTSLTTAPILPATTIGASSYGLMFMDCTSLTDAPMLIAKNIPEGAYKSMFENCTALVNPPIILAESVAGYGCDTMFKGCTSLERCPDLLFTTLTGEYCCLRMFEKCVSLTRPANLYSTTIVEGAYNYMYDGCTGIKWGTTGEPYRIPCVGEGTAVDPASFAQFMFTGNSGLLPEGNGDPKLNTTYYFGSESNGLLFTSPNAFTVALKPDTPYTPNANFKISKDGETWEDTTWDENNGISLVADTLNPNLGEYSVYIKGDNHFNNGFDYNSRFSVTSGNNISVSGDLDDLWGKLPITDNECTYLFAGMTQLINAENLRFPKETATGCYFHMFIDCNNLINPPALLPAKRVGSTAYYYMFGNCTSLAKTPIILGDTICTTDTPDHVQGSQCFGMFRNTGITEIPTLLFNNFELNDMNSVDEGETFGNMFSACHNLTNISGVLMPAQTLPHSACYKMFEMCDNLVSVSLNLLPATTLGDQCYCEMFDGCTSLTNTPGLPATILESDCYQGMFKGCVALTKPRALPTLTSIYYSMSEMYLGCGIKWAASGNPYEIKTEDGSTDQDHTTNMFKNNIGALPEGTGTPKLNTVYYYE